jgi:hypothetical protein
MWHRIWAPGIDLKLHRDCHVELDYVLYSAPFTFIGQTSWVRVPQTSRCRAFRITGSLPPAYVRSHRCGDRRTVLGHLRRMPASASLTTISGAERSDRPGTELIEQLLTDRIVEQPAGRSRHSGLCRHLWVRAGGAGPHPGTRGPSPDVFEQRFPQ